MTGIVASAWRMPSGFVDNPFAKTYKLHRVAPITEAPGPSRQQRFLRRMGLHAMDVAYEAFHLAGLVPGERFGLFTAVGGLRAHWDDLLSALAEQVPGGERAWERGLASVHPYWMLRHLSNNVHALAAQELLLSGDGATFGGPDAGLHALRSAQRALRDGAIDAALVVAYDSLLEPETLVELGERVPADFVPGEAAVAVVLTSGETTLRFADRDRVIAQYGHIGAATALVQLVMAEQENA